MWITETISTFRPLWCAVSSREWKNYVKWTCELNQKRNSFHRDIGRGNYLFSETSFYLNWDWVALDKASISTCAESQPHLTDGQHYLTLAAVSAYPDAIWTWSSNPNHGRCSTKRGKWAKSRDIFGQSWPIKMIFQFGSKELPTSQLIFERFLTVSTALYEDSVTTDILSKSKRWPVSY